MSRTALDGTDQKLRACLASNALWGGAGAAQKVIQSVARKVIHPKAVHSTLAPAPGPAGAPGPSSGRGGAGWLRRRAVPGPPGPHPVALPLSREDGRVVGSRSSRAVVSFSSPAKTVTHSANARFNAEPMIMRSVMERGPARTSLRWSGAPHYGACRQRGDQLVRGCEAARSQRRRNHRFESFQFHRRIRTRVHLRRLHVGMSEPERDFAQVPRVRLVACRTVRAQVRRSTPQNRPFRRRAKPAISERPETGEFYCADSSERKSACKGVARPWRRSKRNPAQILPPRSTRFVLVHRGEASTGAQCRNRWYLPPHRSDRSSRTASEIDA
jgi:hypothetical protein